MLQCVWCWVHVWRSARCACGIVVVRAWRCVGYICAVPCLVCARVVLYSRCCTRGGVLCAWCCCGNARECGVVLVRGLVRGGCAVVLAVRVVPDVRVVSWCARSAMLVYAWSVLVFWCAAWWCVLVCVALRWCVCVVLCCYAGSSIGWYRSPIGAREWAIEKPVRSRCEWFRGKIVTGLIAPAQRHGPTSDWQPETHPPVKSGYLYVAVSSLVSFSLSFHYHSYSPRNSVLINKIERFSQTPSTNI
jgi:hypothetical protein